MTSDPNYQPASLQTVRTILRQQPARKRWGQNFLVQPRVVDRMIDVMGLEDSDSVLEIGPGLGALTKALAAKCRHVTAVDIDPFLIRTLSLNLPVPNLKLIHHDFLTYDLAAMSGPLVAAGNLPYYCATPIIERLLEHQKLFSRIYLLVQKEYGERMCAVPGNKTYGSLTCFVRFHADVKRHFEVGPGCFFPAPKVRSVFLELRGWKARGLNEVERERFFGFTRSLFGQRRKTLRRVLMSRLDKKAAGNALDASGIEGGQRPEVLSVEDLLRLWKEVDQRGE